MTHRRWLPATALALTTLGLCLGGGGRTASAADDGPTIEAYAYRAQFLRGGQFMSVFVKVGTLDPNLTVTMDGAGLLTDGFVQRMTWSDLYFCPDDRVGCHPCPAGHRCFRNATALILDVRTAGRVELPIVVTEGNGRVTRTTLPLDIGRADDRDGDGMADFWESWYQLSEFYADNGPNDDPDRDGRTNLEEFRRGTNPRAKYVTYFAEASSGDRGAGIEQCFRLVSLRSGGFTGGSWLTLIGDDGRRSEQAGVAGCPLSRQFHPADRAVAAIVESEEPVFVERYAVAGTQVYPPATPTTPSAISSTGVAAPATRWHFADGGTDGETDTFYLFFNPGSEPVNVTMSYRGDDGRLLLRRMRRVEPGARRTVWVNADDPSLGRVPAFTEITASAPVLVERAWRFDPPGRTVTQASASPGVAAPSTRWIFPEVDGRDRTETTIVVANPSSRDVVVDVSLLYEDREELRPGALSIRAGGRSAIPARLLDGLAGTRASVEVVSRSGIGIVAERTIAGRDAGGPWRLASAGATLSGVEWVIPTADGADASDIVVTNASPTPATVQVRFMVNDDFGSEAVRTVVIPARQRLVYPLGGSRVDPRYPFLPGRVSVTSQGTGGARAGVVVELVRRGRDHGASRERAAGFIAGRMR